MKLHKIRVIEKEEITEVSNFIARLNHNEQAHIGYCGTDGKEIAKSMREEISDVKYTDSFVVAYENKQLIGVLGFDADLERNVAEIWGPFILPDKWRISRDLWKKMTELLPPEISSLEMFPNSKNIHACDLATSLSFKKSSDESILVFERGNGLELEQTTLELEELTLAFYPNMKQLHDKAFPRAYYNGEQIVNQIDAHRKVFIITKNSSFSGYIYVETEPEFGEASIEFFAVEESARGNGIGRQLLMGALKWIFTFEDMESITLCVNSANNKAINLYKKSGFRHVHDLCSFIKEIRPDRNK